MSDSLTDGILLQHHFSNRFLQLKQKLDETSVQMKLIFVLLNFNVYYKIAFIPRAVEVSRRVPVKLMPQISTEYYDYYL